MQRATRFIRPIVLALLTVSACGTGSYNDWPYPYSYNYPYWYTDYGTYTYVRRPIHVVDGWTSRAFRYRPYRGYAIRRHNSPVVTYRATKDDATIEVDLTPQGDSVKVEVRARNGTDKWNAEQAKDLMGRILAETETGSSR